MTQTPVQTAFEEQGSRLFVLGTIHRDDEGPELLHEWLMKIMPHVITLEFSNYGMEFRKNKGNECKKRIEKIVHTMDSNNQPYDANALSLLFAYIDIPYEYEIASRYAEDRGALLYLIDMDTFSYLKLKEIDELLDEDNIKQLLCGINLQDGNNEKVAARLFFEKDIKLFPYTDEMYMRDKYMSDRISTLMKQHKNETFLHICGWQHLQDPCGLYAPFNPIKVFYYD